MLRYTSGTPPHIPSHPYYRGEVRGSACMQGGNVHAPYTPVVRPIPSGPANTTPAPTNTILAHTLRPIHYTLASTLRPIHSDPYLGMVRPIHLCDCIYILYHMCTLYFTIPILHTYRVTKGVSIRLSLLQIELELQMEMHLGK